LAHVGVVRTKGFLAGYHLDWPVFTVTHLAEADQSRHGEPCRGLGLRTIAQRLDQILQHGRDHDDAAG
jgi:hypothetical protein